MTKPENMTDLARAINADVARINEAFRPLREALMEVAARLAESSQRVKRDYDRAR